ncbi:MAG: D-sedoheptulose 7-phosphate isomerase [Sediminibacterium sp.]|jgi:D-sedoheptulose 7-phosphate isomerase|nr:D-sedoheptulose 7-phosphate isomerase [Sediminibacterium sp.]
MKDRIQYLVQSSINVKSKVVADEHILSQVDQIVQLLVNCFQSGKRVWFCGNGGSAADAQHLAAEFSGRFYKNRKALPAEALHCNTSYLTAVANDYSFNQIYARLVDGICEAGDVLLAFSTSGNSTNIIEALEVARDKGVHAIGFTGSAGGKMNECCDILVKVPSSDTPRIQEVHMLLGHIICELTENLLFPE